MKLQSPGQRIFETAYGKVDGWIGLFEPYVFQLRSVTPVDGFVRIHHEGGPGEVLVKLKKLLAHARQLHDPYTDELIEEIFEIFIVGIHNL